VIDFKDKLRAKREQKAKEKEMKPKRQKKPEGELSPAAQAIADRAGEGTGHKAFLRAIHKRLKGD